MRAGPRRYRHRAARLKAAITSFTAPSAAPLASAAARQPARCVSRATIATSRTAEAMMASVECAVECFVRYQHRQSLQGCFCRCDVA